MRTGRPKKGAKDWLAGQIATGFGMVAMDDVISRAEAAGYSRATLYRAKKDMALATVLDANKLYWTLPLKEESVKTPVENDRLHLKPRW